MKRKLVVWPFLFATALILLSQRSAVLRAQEEIPAEAPPAAAPIPPEAPKDDQPFQEKGDVVRINFPKMELEAVLRHMSEITRRNFLMDQIPKGEVQMIGPIGPIEIPKKEAFNFFILILNLSGYQVVETSVTNVYKVVRTADAMEGARIIGPNQTVAPTDEMVIRFINLRYVSATDLAGQLTQLASKSGGKVMAYEPTNTLIVVDTAYNIKRMLRIISFIDVPSPEPEIEIVMIKYAAAEEISGILSQVYGSEQGGGPRTATNRPVPPTARNPRARQPVPESPAAPTVISASPTGATVKIIPVERLNALVLIAERSTIEAIKELIAKLDIDVGGRQNIHVYYCQNAEASELAGTLASLSGKGGVRTSSSSARETMPSAPTQPGMSPARPTTPTRRTTPQPSGGADTAVLSGILQGEVTITADEATNSLIIVATDVDYAVLQSVIEKLDIPRRQVFVEAVLLEVTYQENRSAGVSMHGASPLPEDGLILAGTGFSGDINSISMLSAISGTAGSLSLPSGITMGALGAPAEVPGTGGAVVIPSAGMVVRLLASQSSVNVLSTPTILTTDNEEASIEVGQKIPVPTGSSIGTGGFSSVQISRESVGIKLQLTPQINESDNVKLQIYVEISGAVSSPAGVDTTSLGVTTSNKSAETTVIVKDSQTIVIGGLMEDRREDNQSWVPFLGDIPVLGWLFKSAAQNKQKTNLIILLTPHIVKGEQDVRRVRHKIEGEYRAMMEEENIEPPAYIDRMFESKDLPPDVEINIEEIDPEAPEDEYNWRWEETPEGASPPRSASTRDAGGSP